MGARGPKPASAEGIFQLASWLYWDLRALAEGKTREAFNRDYFKEEAKKEPPRLDDADRTHIAQFVDAEIKDGKLEKDQRKERIRTLEADLLVVKGLDRRRAAADRAWQGKKVPGDPEVLEKLLRAKDAKRIQRICKDAHTVRPEKIWGEERDIRVDNWPIQTGSLLPEYLSKHAEQFIEAKSDPRFPRSTRPSNQLKQLWFLARALAGAVNGVKPRTAINLVGSTRPEQLFKESRAGKSVRRRKRSDLPGSRQVKY
jgi:hypothetical protein